MANRQCVQKGLSLSLLSQGHQPFACRSMWHIQEDRQATSKREQRRLFRVSMPHLCSDLPF